MGISRVSRLRAPQPGRPTQALSGAVTLGRRPHLLGQDRDLGYRPALYFAKRRHRHLAETHNRGTPYVELASLAARLVNTYARTEPVRSTDCGLARPKSVEPLRQREGPWKSFRSRNEPSNAKLRALIAWKRERPADIVRVHIKQRLNWQNFCRSQRSAPPSHAGTDCRDQQSWMAYKKRGLKGYLPKASAGSQLGRSECCFSRTDRGCTHGSLGRQALNARWSKGAPFSKKTIAVGFFSTPSRCGKRRGRSVPL